MFYQDGECPTINLSSREILIWMDSIQEMPQLPFDVINISKYNLLAQSCIVLR